MKQRSSRDLTEKTENGSNRNAPAHRENILCPKAPTENASGVKEERLTWGAPHVRFEKPRRRPKAAVVAGVEPRRVREIGVYQEYQRVLLRRWVVDLGVGEHRVDGDTFSGERIRAPSCARGRGSPPFRGRVPGPAGHAGARGVEDQLEMPLGHAIVIERPRGWRGFGWVLGHFGVVLG